MFAVGAPLSPLMTSVDARNGHARVSFTPNANDGGSAVSAFFAVAEPDTGHGFQLTSMAHLRQTQTQNARGKMALQFTPPSVAGTQFASGSSSPLTISNLQNGVVYSFAVIAENQYGDSPVTNSSLFTGVIVGTP